MRWCPLLPSKVRRRLHILNLLNSIRGAKTEHQRQVTSAMLPPGLRRPPPGATLIELPVIIRRSTYDRRPRPLGKVLQDVLTVMEVDPGLSDDGGRRGGGCGFSAK